MKNPFDVIGKSYSIIPKLSSNVEEVAEGNFEPDFHEDNDGDNTDGDTNRRSEGKVTSKGESSRIRNENEFGFHELTHEHDDNEFERRNNEHPWWSRNWTALESEDDGFHRIRYIVGSPETVKLLKFWFVTMISIILTHWIVRYVGWEHDDNYSLADFVQYDLHHVCLDTFVYFVVGRLHQRRGVDRLWPCVLPWAWGCVQPSWETDWPLLRQSVSLYAMHCQWPWMLWGVVAFVACLLGRLVFCHVRAAVHDRLLVSRSLELAACLAVFVLPFVSNPNFHFHHWYASWLFGMHSNLDRPWSEAVLYFAWGAYINGIAVYGRDPILSCAYSFYLATDNRCYFMECYTVDDDNGDDNGNYRPFVPPDWQNCTGGGPA